MQLQPQDKVVIKATGQQTEVHSVSVLENRPPIVRIECQDGNTYDHWRLNKCAD